MVELRRLQVGNVRTKAAAARGCVLVRAACRKAEMREAANGVRFVGGIFRVFRSTGWAGGKKGTGINEGERLVLCRCEMLVRGCRRTRRGFGVNETVENA